MKCGNCHTNSTANRATAGHSISPRAAVHPINGGSAPGNAPINVFKEVMRFSGETRQFKSLSFRGGESVRNFCPACGGLVFGGIVGVDESHTIYAGSLDDPSAFQPQMAIFDRDRPDWVPRPPWLTVFETMPE